MIIRSTQEIWFCHDRCIYSERLVVSKKVLFNIKLNIIVNIENVVDSLRHLCKCGTNIYATYEARCQQELYNTFFLI